MHKSEKLFLKNLRDQKRNVNLVKFMGVLPLLNPNNSLQKIDATFIQNVNKVFSLNGKKSFFTVFVALYCLCRNNVVVHLFD